MFDVGVKKLMNERNAMIENIAIAATCNHVARMEQAEAENKMLRESLSVANIELDAIKP